MNEASVKPVEQLEAGTDIQKWEARQPVATHAPAPNDYLGALIARGADLATLEKFMDLKERHEANEARKAYHEAMAAFKANPPEILKNRKASFGHKTGDGKTEYSYAGLDQVAGEIGKAMSPHGLSFAWSTDQNNNVIKVSCTITHVMGHSESTSLEAGADQSGKKNPIQAVGSTITYLQKYTLFALTGLAAKGQDDDGNAAGGEAEPVINEKQKGQILDFLAELGDDTSALLKWQNVATVEEIPAKNFKAIIAELSDVLAKRKAAK